MIPSYSDYFSSPFNTVSIAVIFISRNVIHEAGHYPCKKDHHFQTHNSNNRFSYIRRFPPSIIFSGNASARLFDCRSKVTAVYVSARILRPETRTVLQLSCTNKYRRNSFFKFFLSIQPYPPVLF